MVSSQIQEGLSEGFERYHGNDGGFNLVNTGNASEFGDGAALAAASGFGSPGQNQ
jgi:hypothetical protein